MIRLNMHIINNNNILIDVLLFKNVQALNFYFCFRGPNVSVLHLRSTSEPWETNTNPTYSTTSSYSTKNYFTRGTASSLPPLTKHQSLSGPSAAYKWHNSPSFHNTAEVNTPEMFVGNVKRELSPVSLILFCIWFLEKILDIKCHN